MCGNRFCLISRCYLERGVKLCAFLERVMRIIMSSVSSTVWILFFSRKFVISANPGNRNCI